MKLNAFSIISTLYESFQGFKLVQSRFKRGRNDLVMLTEMNQKVVIDIVCVLDDAGMSASTMRLVWLQFEKK